MKKAPIVIIVAILGLVVLVKAGILDSLMLFILAGIIPGTKYAIPSSFMLLLIMSTAWLLFFNLIPTDTLRTNKPAKKGAAKKQLPKQRYKQI